MSNTDLECIEASFRQKRFIYIIDMKLKMYKQLLENLAAELKCSQLDAFLKEAFNDKHRSPMNEDKYVKQRRFSIAAEDTCIQGSEAKRYERMSRREKSERVVMESQRMRMLEDTSGIKIWQKVSNQYYSC